MKKRKILAIYYSPDSFDCYSAYYNEIEKTVDGKHFYSLLGMSENPFHPQGFCQHSSGQLGRHNGHKITFHALPDPCKQALLNSLYLEDIPVFLPSDQPETCRYCGRRTEIFAHENREFHQCDCGKYYWIIP